MTFRSRLTLPVVVASLFVMAFPPSHAQDPPRTALPAVPEGPAKPAKVDGPALPDLTIEVKPLPPVAIPDDPPPHEGAFFDLPMTVEPPDILVVEVLVARAGRPITGERIVRPDGTIDLGFYGKVHVRGLTLEQVKVKVILQLRKYLNDEALGLIQYVEPAEEMPDADQPASKGEPTPAGPDKGQAKPDPADPKISGVSPFEDKPDRHPKPAARRGGRPFARQPGRDRSGRPILSRDRPISIQDAPKPERSEPARDGPKPAAKPKAEPGMVVVEEVLVAVPLKVVPPADSDRVFVDFASYNSQVYYTQGDVGVPGRLAFTGGETVLDALNYAGGLIPSSEPVDIHLYRPARGGKPAKDYKIDLEAIRKGVATANYQVFPNDRLVVGRNPIVTRTTEVDRAGSLINSLMNSILQYSYTARSMAVMNAPPSGGPGATSQVRVNGQNVPVADPPVMTPARRDASIQEWVELLWSVSGKEGGAMLDEKAFKEALMKKLTPAPEPN